MNIVTKHGWTLLSVSALWVGSVFASAAIAQDVDAGAARVPFVVNMAATVTAMPADGGAVSQKISMDANVEDTLRLPLRKTDGVRFFGARRHANAPAIVVGNGKVTVNLPAAQSYENAEVLLYTVNGKRIMRNKVSATRAANNVSRRNVATGVYLLSVKGVDGGVIASRITHSGGGLDINVAFNDEKPSTSVSRAAAKKAEGVGEDWIITVNAYDGGYDDSVYTLRVDGGVNRLQNITLLKAGVRDASRDPAVIEGLKWTSKNLNIDTEGSWCYENSPDSCAKYGRLYTWEAAVAVCRLIGWRLPSNEDWDSLYGNDVALKSTSGWPDNGNGTDDYGFSALPGGTRDHLGDFSDAGSFAEWWTSTTVVHSDKMAYTRYMYSSSGAYCSLCVGSRNWGNGYSVRCVSDE